jgi:catechol 2,3-dioxygenase-like lactoylglutathione lyase family enzyme
VNRLIGVGLHVGALERSLDFYLNCLGMTETQRIQFDQMTEVILSFRDSSEANVLLVANPSTPAASAPTDWGRLVVGVPDVDAARELLLAAGHTVSEVIEVPDHDARVVMTADPDGYPLELVQITSE